MQTLLLLTVDDEPFDANDFRRVVETVKGFDGVRFDEPGGAAVEAKYSDGVDKTTVRLSGNLTAISVSDFTDVAFEVVMILQRHLARSLRIIDMEYTFDLPVSDYANARDLRLAIERTDVSE